ncbi:DNA ligase [Ethanoligenens sp.]|uniref:DNA ligase n=1 Tax=Ethanoligenens sp. TaxID=2099655 RepID=UPI0039EA5ED6
MSKMSDIAMTIEELRKCAAAISDAADWLSGAFNANAPAPKEEPAPTLEVVRAILADKSRKGYTAQIRSLLQKYGASKLSEIDPNHYGELLADVEGLTDAT